MRPKTFNPRTSDYEVSDWPAAEDWHDEAPKSSQAPFPKFEPGTVMIETGIYVDENNCLWFIEPEKGSIYLIGSDRDS
jgi:hypothetical protein